MVIKMDTLIMSFAFQCVVGIPEAPHCWWVSQRAWKLAQSQLTSKAYSPSMHPQASIQKTMHTGEDSQGGPGAPVTRIPQDPSRSPPAAPFLQRSNPKISFKFVFSLIRKSTFLSKSTKTGSTSE